jgi:hypothetical protein
LIIWISLEPSATKITDIGEWTLRRFQSNIRHENAALRSSKMLLLFLISSLFLNPGNEALPVIEHGNPPPPSTLDTFTSKRSVYGIVWSCIVTTFLCAWVSLHPNTIHRLGGRWERAGQRVRLFLLTVIAPEFVIGLAWWERRAAKKTKVDFWNNGKFAVSS